MERIFDLDPQLIQDALFLAVNIFILFIAGSYLLYNPVRNLLKKRQDLIEADLETARKDKEDAAALKSEYDARIKTAHKDADVILEKKIIFPFKGSFIISESVLKNNVFVVKLKPKNN